jgi:uncharacterized membrane protein
MNKSIKQWFQRYYSKVIGSIAFYPALMAVAFLILSWGMLELDFSPWGKEVKSGMRWLRLQDPSTARSIISTIAGAVISLTVFSFSMVMIVLNQAASQMSNRVLTSMIQNRFQQLVLGFYIGTIVYALFLLSTIRDISSGIYIPALSIYLLIFFTIVSIFLFIYFLDYVTRTVKFETVIDRVMNQTFETMKKNFVPIETEDVFWQNLPFIEIKTQQSNYFQSFDEKRLLELARSENVFVSILHPPGTFLIEGIVFIKVYAEKTISEDCRKNIASVFDFYSGQPIDINADYGFRQLAEIAIKALSPGINDPGTAVIAVHSIASLLCYRLERNLPTVRKDDKKMARIHIPVLDFHAIFEQCIVPIWNYGKTDQYIQKELLFLIQQLNDADSKNRYSKLFNDFTLKIKKSAGPD